MDKFLLLFFDDGGLMVDWTVCETDRKSIGSHALDLLTSDPNSVFVEVYASGEFFTALNGELQICTIRL